jgi:hypothetical protein
MYLVNYKIKKVFSANGYTNNMNDFFLKKFAINKTITYMNSLNKLLSNYEKDLKILNYREELENDSRGKSFLHPNFKLFNVNNDKTIFNNLFNRLYHNFNEIKGEKKKDLVDTHDKNLFLNEYLLFFEKYKNDFKNIYDSNKNN